MPSHSLSAKRYRRYVALLSTVGAYRIEHHADVATIALARAGIEPRHVAAPAAARHIRGVHSAFVLALMVAVAPVPSTDAVTHDLRDRDRAGLAGCWMSRAHETWTFRETGEHGLEVVLDSRDSHHRAIPSPVMYAPKTNNFAFATAGRIHGLMLVFTFDADHGRIDASVYSKHDQSGYFFTGNDFTLTRCPATKR